MRIWVVRMTLERFRPDECRSTEDEWLYDDVVRVHLRLGDVVLDEEGGPRRGS